MFVFFNFVTVFTFFFNSCNLCISRKLVKMFLCVFYFICFNIDKLLIFILKFKFLNIFKNLSEI